MQHSFTCSSCGLFNPGTQPYQHAGPMCRCKDPTLQQLRMSIEQQQLLYQNASSVPTYIIRMEQKLDDILRIVKALAGIS